MCELLIFIRNNTHADPEKDRRGCYKRGMIVGVQSDGHVWGSKETLPDFVIVKIPGVAVAAAEELLEHQIEDDTGVPTLDGDGKPVVFRRRRWRAVVDPIPNAIKNTLLTTGTVTVTVNQIKNYLQRVRDNAVYAGL